MPAKNSNWQTHWEEISEEHPFSTMGRNSYSISDFFVYARDISNALGPLNYSKNMLDAAGGAGYISMYMASFINRIDLFDYSQPLISRALKECDAFDNIHPYVDNLLTLEATFSKRCSYDYVLIGSALQYFEDLSQIETILKNVYQVCRDGAKVLISHNPDSLLKESFIKSYDKLEWDKDRIEQAKKDEENLRLWLNYDEVSAIALQIGFKTSTKRAIHPKLFQSTHMFDWLLVK